MVFNGRICVLNCENLFLNRSVLAENKSEYLCELLAYNMRLIDADIFLLTEVGGQKSLEKFNELYLRNSYREWLIPGNSDRGIDVGALVKKNLVSTYKSNRNFELDFIYRHERLKKNRGQKLAPHKFSRDVCELWVLDESEQPILVILNVHLKSQLDPQQIDIRGTERRAAEVEGLIKIYQELKERLDCPIFIAGDFNGNASKSQTDREFQSIYDQTSLIDALELMHTPSHERGTYYVFRRDSKALGKQLDYFFVPDEKKELVKQAFIWHYCGPLNETMFPPSHKNRSALPSDHLPVVIDLGGG